MLDAPITTVGEALAADPLFRGPTCPHCGEPRPRVCNSQGKPVLLWAPCLCRWPGAEVPGEARDKGPGPCPAVPPQYLGASFADFPAERADFEQFVTEARGLLTLLGSTGVGKTRVCYSFKQFAHHHGWPCKMVYSPSLLTQIGRAPNGVARAERLGKFGGLLILDDVGAESPAPWELRLLLILLHDREEWQRPTLLTTNLSMRALSAVSERLTSRIAGGRVLELGGPDRRLTRHQEE